MWRHLLEWVAVELWMMWSVFVFFIVLWHLNEIYWSGCTLSNVTALERWWNYVLTISIADRYAAFRLLIFTAHEGKLPYTRMLYIFLWYLDNWMNVKMRRALHTHHSPVHELVLETRSWVTYFRIAQFRVAARWSRSVLSVQFIFSLNHSFLNFWGKCNSLHRTYPHYITGCCLSLTQYLQTKTVTLCDTMEFIAVVGHQYLLLKALVHTEWKHRRWSF